MLKSKNGFTLLEMVITMAIFSIVILVVGTSFNTLLKYSTRFMKSEEGNIEGNVGLEVMRHDISSAGFGLPTSYGLGGAPNYLEVDGSHTLAAALNDAPQGVPRAVAGSFNTAAVSDAGYTTLAGSDYLALKATSLGIQSAAQKWSYAGYTSIPPKRPKSWNDGNLVNGDRVIALDRSASDTTGSYNLLKDPTSGSFWTTYSDAGLPAGFSASSPQDMVYIYGIAGSGVSSLRMPFNRADYFVATPPSGSLPAYCAPNTGILYRGLAKHEDGSLDYQPLVDCVAAMHVVLGWNMLDSSGSVVTDPNATGSGAVDTWTNLSGGNISSTGSIPPTLAQMMAPGGVVADPAQIRTKLKVVKVYILAQDGRKDAGYTSRSYIKMYSDEEGQTPLGAAASFNLAPEMLNYRWKVYKLVIRPKNLVSNQ
ncbi:MAG TPA: type II secretion system protein [Geomonas sp.]|nr:type II secretion system protein [Geomonas sp.]